MDIETINAKCVWDFLKLFEYDGHEIEVCFDIISHKFYTLEKGINGELTSTKLVNYKILEYNENDDRLLIHKRIYSDNENCIKFLYVILSFKDDKQELEFYTPIHITDVERYNKEVKSLIHN